MTILITGSTGALGSELKKIFPEALTPNHNELNITNREQIINFLNNSKILDSRYKKFYHGYTKIVLVQNCL